METRPSSSGRLPPPSVGTGQSDASDGASGGAREMEGRERGVEGREKAASGRRVARGCERKRVLRRGARLGDGPAGRPTQRGGAAGPACRRARASNRGGRWS